MAFNWVNNRLEGHGFLWNPNRNAGNPLPVITGISTPALPATLITLDGSNFRDSQLGGGVEFTQGATELVAQISTWSDSRVIVIAPAVESSAVKYGAINVALSNEFNDLVVSSVDLITPGSRVYVDVSSYDSTSGLVVEFLSSEGFSQPKAGDQAAYEPQVYEKDGIAVAGFIATVNDDLSYSVEGAEDLPVGEYEIRSFRVYDSDNEMWGDLKTVGFTVSLSVQAPQFTSQPAISNISSSTFGVSFTADETGDYRLVTLSSGSPAPTSTEVLAGTGSGGAVPLFASLVLSMAAGVEVITTVTGMIAGDEVDSYIAMVDAQSNESVSSALTVTPSATNNAPVVTPPANATLHYANGAAGLFKNDLLLTDWDATASVTDDVDSVTVSGDYSSLPDPITAGTYTITFSSTNDSGGLSDSKNATLIIAESVGNTLPVFNSTNSFSVVVDQQATHLVSASDSDGDSLSFSVSGSWPTGYSLVDNGNNTATITVQSSVVVVQQITVIVSDGNDTAEQVVTVTVSAVANSKPTFGSPVVVANEGVLYEYTPNVSDVDGDSITLSLVTSPDWMSLVGGKVVGTPTSSDVGVIPVTLRADDGSEYSDQNFTVVVYGVPIQGNSDEGLVFDTPSFRRIPVKRLDDEPNRVFQQDPLERNDYLIDVARFLEGDPVVGATWASDPGITVTQGGSNNTQSVIWVEGGTDGVNYYVWVILTSAKNRRKKVKFLIAINEE